MPSQYNQNQIELIKDRIKQAKSVILVDYSETDANDQIKLRAAIKEAQGEMFVAKNTLINIALGKEELKESLTGMNALVFSYEDAVSALKKLFEFHEGAEKLDIKQGVMVEDGKIQVLSREQVKKLSQMPRKDELIVMLIRRVQGPAYGLVNVLSGGPRKLIYALEAIRKQQAAAN
jgi:large subunit ribosomal protein L10